MGKYLSLLALLLVGCGGAPFEASGSPVEASSAKPAPEPVPVVKDAGKVDSGAETGDPEGGAEAASESGTQDDGASDAKGVCMPYVDVQSIWAAPQTNDAGASPASCNSCIIGSCSAEVAQCNQTCACVTTWSAFVDCLNSGGSMPMCGSILTNAGLSVTCAVGCATPQTC